MVVTVVGLGRMGHAVACRLLAVGQDLRVYNRTADKAAELGRDGARVAQSVAEACDGCDVVITVLANDIALHDLTCDAGGIRDTLRPGAIHVAMGTHGVDAIQAVAQAHADAQQEFVAAPVLGPPPAAESGQLTIVAAGSARALSGCRPLLETLGARTFEVGRHPEDACTIKLTANLVLACAVGAMGEAFSLVRKSGLEPQVLFDVLADSLWEAPAYRHAASTVMENRYDEVGMTAELGLKDLNLVLAAGDWVHVPLPSANALRDRLLGAIAHGDGELDWRVLAREQARASGLGGVASSA